MSDEEAALELSSLKGIGIWTAEMILLFCMQRPNINLADEFFKNEVQGVNLQKPEGTYVIVPDFTQWCIKNETTLDELLLKGVEVGVLWKDGRQFHIPQEIRMSLGLPTQKLLDVLNRLKQYVL